MNDNHDIFIYFFGSQEIGLWLFSYSMLRCWKKAFKRHTAIVMMHLLSNSIDCTLLKSLRTGSSQRMTSNILEGGKNTILVLVAAYWDRKKLTPFLI